MDASNRLNNIAREALKRDDTSVEQVSTDLEFVESISKHHTDRAASVHQDTPNVEVRDIRTDNEWNVMEENDTKLILLVECNGAPT